MAEQQETKVVVGAATAVQVLLTRLAECWLQWRGLGRFGRVVYLQGSRWDGWHANGSVTGCPGPR